MFAEEPPSWGIELGASGTCERCGEEAATVHLLRVVDGAVSHTRLCSACAEGIAEDAEGLALVLALPSALHGTTGKRNDPKPSTPDRKPEQREHFCQSCGTTLADVKESGLVGCAECYKVFTDYLEELLAGDAEPSEHLGKIPHRGPETDNLRHEMLRLHRMLRELVECERFEEAAGVRDRLSELGQRLGEGE